MSNEEYEHKHIRFRGMGPGRPLSKGQSLEEQWKPLQKEGWKLASFVIINTSYDEGIAVFARRVK